MIVNSGSIKRTDLVVRVLSATALVLLEEGPRRLRTAEIARRAQTTESTIFRHFTNGLEELLRETFDWCWETINARIAVNRFARPLMGAREQLLSDSAALWAMRDHEIDRAAATCGFLFMRRSPEILGSDYICAALDEFDQRVRALSEAVVQSGETSHHDARVLSLLVENYMATVWLTWFCMPTGETDMTERVHDLSTDEAQMGMYLLLSREMTPGAVDLLESING